MMQPETSPRDSLKLCHFTSQQIGQLPLLIDSWTALKLPALLAATLYSSLLIFKLSRIGCNSRKWTERQRTSLGL